MAHQRWDLVEVTIGQVTLLARGSIVVVERETVTEWEVVATTLDDEPIDPGVHDLVVETDTGDRWQGQALHVRSVDATHVFRGAGELTRGPSVEAD